MHICTYVCELQCIIAMSVYFENNNHKRMESIKALKFSNKKEFIYTRLRILLKESKTKIFVEKNLIYLKVLNFSLRYIKQKIRENI